MDITCSVCMRGCTLKEGQTGFCRSRKNTDGVIKPIHYGKITSMALDPIEKKPLAMFYPKSQILSIGGSGCNLRCPFCQNHPISMSDGSDLQTMELSPEKLTQQALSLQKAGNIGVAYTYNEPLIDYEYVRDCAKLIQKTGMKNVVVTNGSFTQEVLLETLPFIDAMNIDLKSFSRDFYKEIGGDLDTVLRFIETAFQKCHVEVTTLIIPGKNDSPEEMMKLSQWLSALSPEIPLHISRFFPQYKMRLASPTPVRQIQKLARTAQRHLKNVFIGNC